MVMLDLDLCSCLKSEEMKICAQRHALVGSDEQGRRLIYWLFLFVFLLLLLLMCEATEESKITAFLIDSVWSCILDRNHLFVGGSSWFFFSFLRKERRWSGKVDGKGLPFWSLFQIKERGRRSWRGFCSKVRRFSFSDQWSLRFCFFP